jgi:hypothetical protein
MKILKKRREAGRIAGLKEIAEAEKQTLTNRPSEPMRKNFK